MNTNLLNIVKQITAKYGEGILADPARLKPLFADYAKNEAKEERVAFGRCIEAGAYLELKKTRTADERRQVKASLANKVHTKKGIGLAQCNDALNLLEAVLFTQTPSKTPPAAHKKKLPLRNMLIAGAVLLIALVIFLVHTSVMRKAQTYYEAGMAYYNKSEYDNAISQFSEAIKLNRKYTLANAYRGDSNRMISQYEPALKDLNEAIRLDPADSFAYARRGDVYRLQGQYDLAVKDFGEAIKLAPNDAFVFAARGDTYRLNEQYDLAIKDLNEAIRLEPNNAFSYTSRGNSYGMKYQFDLALKDLNEAIRLEPEDAFAYASRGNIYSMRGQYNLALKDYDEAIRLYNIKIFYSQYADNTLSLVQMKEEEINVMLKERKDKLTDTNHAWAYANRGQVHFLLGQKDQAVMDFENAVSLNPDYDWAKRRLREIRGY